MRRKVISGLLSVVLMTTSCLFVGCGSTSSSGSAGTSASVGEDAQSAESTASISEDATAKSDSADKVKITYAQWGNDTETAACQKVADKFNASQDKIEVEVLKIDYDNYISKLNTMATANNVDVYGCTVNTLPWQLEVWCKSNGGGFYSEDGKTCIINQKEATDAIQAVADLSLKYHCAPPISDASQALSTSLGSEKVVMATDGAWNVGTYLGPDAKFKYSVGVLPYFKDKVTICTGGPNVVFATTKHPEEAMTWLKWYYQEENSWSLIEAGTWMPILDKWYTDSTLTDKWINNPNFPDHDTYKSAVVDYAKNNSKSTAWYTVAGTDVFNTSLATALSYVWTGDKTAQQAMDEYYDELNGIFTENNQ